MVQKRFKFPENSVELYAEKVNNRGLCAIAQGESSLQASRRSCCPKVHTENRFILQILKPVNAKFSVHVNV